MLRAVTTGDGECHQIVEKEMETRRGSLHHVQRADDLRLSARDCAPTIVTLVPGARQAERFKGVEALRGAQSTSTGS